MSDASFRALNFQDHRRELDSNRHIYAVVSRRSRGLSIGVNLNADKVCNFDCPYCQVDRTVPGGPRVVDRQQLRGELDQLLDLVQSGTLWGISPFNTAAMEFRRVNDIAFAGDGEPTTCRDFPGVVASVVESRDAHGLSAVRIHLLTNATMFHRPAVWSGLELLAAAGGEIWAKLDAGTEAWFQRVDGTTLPFSLVLRNIERAALHWPIVLQSMFHTWEGVGPSPQEIEAFAGRIGAILAVGGSIRQVQVYSVARRPADTRVGVLPLDGLEEIARVVRETIAQYETTTEVVVYEGVSWDDS